MHQLLASVRASQDDRPSASVPVDFYRRARENAERANLVVVNHALLLKNSLGIEAEEDVPFAGSVICDEAHTLEDAATKAWRSASKNVYSAASYALFMLLAEVG